MFFQINGSTLYVWTRKPSLENCMNEIELSSSPQKKRKWSKNEENKIKKGLPIIITKKQKKKKKKKAQKGTSTTPPAIKAVLPCSSKEHKRVGPTAELHLVRTKGVFAEGIQPKNVIIVIDEKIPSLSLNIKNKTSCILKGFDLSPNDFLDLILNFYGSEIIAARKKCSVYLIQPWFSFFMENFDGLVLQNNSLNDNVQKFEGIDLINPLSKEQVVELLSICNEFSAQIIENDLKILICAGEFTYGKGVEDASLLETITLLTRRLLYSALQLRATVIANTFDCEVVFATFPILLLQSDEVKNNLINKVNLLEC